MLSKLIENFKPKRICPKEQAEKELRAKQLVNLLPPDKSQNDVKLDSSKVRLVVFRDHEGRGKVPVFDSTVNISPTPADTELTYAPRSLTQSLCNNLHVREDSVLSLSGSLTSSRRPFLERRPSSDAELLGEMMFGSMPMKLPGSSLKIHYISSQEQLLVTKVFSLQRRPTMASCSITDLTDSCPLPSEMSSQVMENSSGPLPKQNGFQYSLRPPSPECKSHSSVTTPPSPTASLPISISPNSSPSGTGVSSSSLTSSLTRRMQRARSTSFENGSGLYYRVFKPSEQTYTRRGRKYAVGVVFNLTDLKDSEKQAFQEFLFSHFPLINAHLEQLREGVEEALSFRRQQLMEQITKCYLKFLEDFIALYSAPRMKAPVWLSIVGQPDTRRDVCGRLMRELISSLNDFDTKETKHFLSTLITAVLAHHLAWVFTVNKSDSTAGRHHDKMVPKSHTLLAESNSYNPLWAQLGDLFGAVSNPLTVSRTIITGKNVAVICRLLYVISYFIRCSEVEFDGPNCLSDLYQQSELDQDSVCSEVLHESRASSAVTDVNESGRHSACPSIGREALVIRPHPFSFSRASSRSRHSSRSESIASEIPHVASSLTGSPSGSSLDQRIGTLRPSHKSNCCYSVPTQLPTMAANPAHSCAFSPTSSLMCFTGPNPGNSDTNGGERRKEDYRSSSRLSFASSDPQHSVCSSPRNTSRCSIRERCKEEDEIVEDKVAPTNCHFNPRPNCCARERQFESMGMCPINDGFMYFHPQSQSSTSPPYLPAPSPEHPQTPYPADPYTSIDSLSTGCHTLSRNGSGSSFFSQSYSQVTPATPPNHSNLTSHSLSKFRTVNVVGSMDSGVFDSSGVAASEACPTDSLQSSGFASRGSVFSRPGSVLSKRSSFTQPSSYTNPSHTNCTSAAASNKQHLPTNGLVQPNGMYSTFGGSCSLPTSPSTSTLSPSTQSCAADSRDDLSTLSRATDIRDNCSTSSHASAQNQEHTGTSCSTALSCEMSGDNNSHTPANHRVSKLFRTIDQAKNHSTARPSPQPPSSSSTLSPRSYSPSKRSNSSPSLQLPPSALDLSLPRNNSYRGLPLASGYCPDLVIDVEGQEVPHNEDDQSQQINGADDIGLQMNTIKLQSVDVEESLSPRSLACVSPGPLARKLQQYKQSVEEERMLFTEQFNEFTQVDMTSVEEEFSLNMFSDANDHNTSLAHSLDFGRSLIGGYCDSYQPDLVLHATSSPVSTFKERLITDLATMVKHSVVDDPVQHGVAIVADTDTWTCQLLAVSKSARTTDVEISSGVMGPSQSVKHLLQSVKGLWDMKMSSQFCLSHLEDKLLELNEQGQILASSLLENGSHQDIRSSLAKLYSVMNIHTKDQPLLLSLASLHAGSTDSSVSQTLTEIVHHTLLH